MDALVRDHSDLRCPPLGCAFPMLRKPCAKLEKNAASRVNTAFPGQCSQTSGHCNGQSFAQPQCNIHPVRTNQAHQRKARESIRKVHRGENCCRAGDNSEQKVGHVDHILRHGGNGPAALHRQLAQGVIRIFLGQ